MSDKNPQPDKEKAEGKPNPDSVLVKIMESIEAWKNQFGEVGITVQKGNRKIHFLLSSQEARAWIGVQFLAHNIGKNLSRLIEDAVGLIQIKAFSEGPTYEVFSRVGEAAGNIYINLMNAEGQFVKVSGNNIEIVGDAPIRFISPKNARELPLPDLSGSVEDFDTILRTECDSDKFIIIAWMVTAFFSRGPYPILVINGEQGSAKTTTTKFIRSLIDPATALTRSFSGTERDLMVAASHSWILCYDNISDISASMSDALCRIATGAGFGVRQNYADKDETIFDASRPILLNGIESASDRQDLLSRCIAIHLPAIPPEERKTDEEISRQFKELAPKLFGALLNLLSACLHNSPNIKPTHLPRMADFAKRTLAIETLIGWDEGDFLTYYEDLLQRSSEEASEGDVVLQGILSLMQGKDFWEGTATELYEELKGAISIDKVKFIPKANKLPLMRLKPVLQSFGIQTEKHRTAGKRGITLRNLNVDKVISRGVQKVVALSDLLKRKL